jgi:uncharacterized protein (TIGR03086 family)
MSSNPTRWSVLAQAHAVLRDAAAGVPDDGWGLPTPCTEWTVGQVVEHATLDQLLYVAALTGGPAPEGDAFRPTGELTGSVPAALVAAEAAFGAVEPDAEAVSVPLPPFTLPPAQAVAAAALDAAVHGWDVAVATGRPSPLTDELAAAVLPTAEGLVEPLRQWGAYAPVVAVARDAGAADRLLGLLGRDPAWAAPR